jgi:hypothetical protein
MRSDAQLVAWLRKQEGGGDDAVREWLALPYVS